MNIYEIKKEYLEILENPNYVNLETGEITETGEKLLNENRESLEEKCENIARFMKNLEGENEAYKKEQERLKALEKSNENKIESLKKYLAFALDGQSLKTKLFKFSFRKSESSNIFDKEKLPSQFITKETIEKIANLTEIKNYLKSEIEARVNDTKADGKKYDENKIKEEVYSENGLNVIFKSNLQIK